MAQGTTLSSAQSHKTDSFDTIPQFSFLTGSMKQCVLVKSVNFCLILQVRLLQP